VVNKKQLLSGLSADGNTLLSVTDHCLRSRNYVNVIVAGKQPALQWIWMLLSSTAPGHRHLGLGEAMTKARNQMLLWPVVRYSDNGWLPLTSASASARH